MVESQATVQTMRLASNLDDQKVLEELLDESKPAVPDDCRGLHFLLFTPFRYSPAPHGSRFRRAHQSEGAFYASEHIETAMAEISYWRLLFWKESPQTKPPASPQEMTAFSVRCRSSRMIDLTDPHFRRQRVKWHHPSDYEASQRLADKARAEGIEVIRYRSVRDPQHRANAAILSPRAFAAKAPDEYQTWHIFIREKAIQIWNETAHRAMEFTHEEVSGWA